MLDLRKIHSFEEMFNDESRIYDQMTVTDHKLFADPKIQGTNFYDENDSLRHQKHNHIDLYNMRIFFCLSNYPEVINCNSTSFLAVSLYKTVLLLSNFHLAFNNRMRQYIVCFCVCVAVEYVTSYQYYNETVEDAVSQQLPDFRQRHPVSVNKHARMQMRIVLKVSPVFVLIHL